jgi:primosomal protein N'
MDGEDFYRQELEQRKTAEFPPYVRLFLLKIDSPNRTAALSTAKRLRALLEEHGMGENIVGETIHPGEKGHLAILLKGEESLLEGVLPELTKVRHVRVEADPSWV